MPTMPVAGIVPRSDVERPADIVVRNAKIYTGDPARPEATAVAITDGKISAIGDDRDILASVGLATKVVDGQNRRVVPGLNDSHLHVVRGGLNYVLELRWDGVPTLTMAMQMLREQAARTPKGQWVRVVGGFTHPCDIDCHRCRDADGHDRVDRQPAGSGGTQRVGAQALTTGRSLHEAPPRQ